MYSRAITTYQDMLLGVQDMQLYGSAADKESAAKEIVCYAVTELMRWSPEEAMEHMTESIMDALKLTSIVKGYITLPPDLIRQSDYDYIIAKCFGISYDHRKQLQRQFQRIQSGEIKKFPKETFKGTNGRAKAAYLLKEFISKNIAAGSIEELYERFADSAAMNKAFERAEIYHVCHRLYGSPLEFLHYSLDTESRDDFLFTLYQLSAVYKETEIAMANNHEDPPAPCTNHEDSPAS